MPSGDGGAQLVGRGLWHRTRAVGGGAQNSEKSFWMLCCCWVRVLGSRDVGVCAMAAESLRRGVPTSGWRRWLAAPGGCSCLTVPGAGKGLQPCRGCCTARASGPLASCLIVYCLIGRNLSSAETGTKQLGLKAQVAAAGTGNISQIILMFSPDPGVCGACFCSHASVPYSCGVI